MVAALFIVRGNPARVNMGSGLQKKKADRTIDPPFSLDALIKSETIRLRSMYLAMNSKRCCCHR